MREKILGALLLVLVATCGPGNVIEPSATTPLPHHGEITIDASPKAKRRMVPPEAFLRAYLVWFGGLSPEEVQKRAHGYDLFGQWSDYLAALGLPDYQFDFPRQTQSNTMMLAALSRLGEALCVRAAQRDLRRSTRPDARVVFAFDPVSGREMTSAEFEARFDVLHRTFLGYPAALAPAGRIPRFLALYRKVRDHHAAGGHLTGEQAGWAAVCTALVQHPEAQLY